MSVLDDTSAVGTAALVPSDRIESRTKLEFLANIGHELRTPMNAVVGMIELALGEDIPERAREYLATARDSSKVMVSLVDDLLELARIRGGRLELGCDHFRFRRSLDQTLRALMLRAQERGLELGCAIEPEVPDLLEGDHLRFRHIVQSLVGNALKFTEQGGVLFRAAVESRENDRVLLRCAVIDTGIGIPPEDHERIFQPFTQADDTLTRRHSGAGLGLAIVRDFVERMGGTIWLESTVGGGTTFHFTVSFRTLPDNLMSAEEEEAVRRLPRTSRTLSILVVEDTPANQKVVRAILEKRGHAVQIAGNGRTAVELFERGAFDIVLMDLQMPCMDGFQTTAAIRALPDEQRRHVPIIAITAYAMSGDRMLCLNSGMDAYLSKPIDAEELVNLVECMAHGSAINVSAALARMGGDRELLCDLAEIFLTDAPKLIEVIDRNLADADVSEVTRAVHSLKGLAANFDARDAQRVAGDMEAAGRAGNLDAVAALRPDLQREIECVFAALRTEGLLTQT